MVEPSSLAETVTPSSFWPDGDEITPLSNWSAACAPVTTIRIAAPANNRLRRFLIDLLLFLVAAAFLEAERYRACASRRACIRSRSFFVRGWGRHRYCLEIRDDRVNLGRLKKVF